jgi:YbbR domain-containing protein
MKKLFHNWRLKLIAVSAAVVLWFFVVGIENSVYLIPEPLTVKMENLGKSVSPSAPLPDVKIYVNARGGETKSLTKNDYEAYVDLSGLGAGSHDLPVLVTNQNAQFPVLKVDPATISVTLAPVGEKEVKLIVESKGAPAAGFTVKEVTTNQQRIKISAANNVLEKIDSLTVYAELSGTETSDVTQSVIPQLPPGLGIPDGTIQRNPEQVTVIAVITPVPGNKTVKIVPVLEGADAADLSGQIIAVPATVTVTGEEKKLKDLTEIKTSPVDVGLLINRDLPLAVDLIMPEGVTRIDPNMAISVMLDSSKNQQKTVFADIKVTKESASFKFKSVDPERIKVSLSGPEAIVKKIMDGDITVNLNLLGMSKPGTLALDINSIIVPPGVGILGFEPAEVKITAN